MFQLIAKPMESYLKSQSKYGDYDYNFSLELYEFDKSEFANINAIKETFDYFKDQYTTFRIASDYDCTGELTCINRKVFINEDCCTYIITVKTSFSYDY